MGFGQCRLEYPIVQYIETSKIRILIILSEINQFVSILVKNCVMKITFCSPSEADECCQDASLAWDNYNYHYSSLYCDNFSKYDVSHC